METTVKCECGRDVPINPPQINADLELICDHQAAEIERLQAIVDATQYDDGVIRIDEAARAEVVE